MYGIPFSFAVLETMTLVRTLSSASITMSLSPITLSMLPASTCSWIMFVLTYGLINLTFSAATELLSSPKSAIVAKVCLFKFDKSNASLSTKTSSPTPILASISMVSPPIPPQPITVIFASLNLCCSLLVTMLIWREAISQYPSPMYLVGIFSPKCFFLFLSMCP